MADINIGEIGEALNDKTDRDLRNVDTIAKADAVIDYQEPTSENSYTWYRKYKSGWVEQGGRVQMNGAISASNKKITFPVPMAGSVYNAGCNNNANVGVVAYIGWEHSTYMTVGVNSGSNTGWTTWQVSGMSAS